MKNEEEEKKLIVFTGGHHSSAMPVLRLLLNKYPQYSVLWLGHKHTLKNDKNPTLEYLDITSLNIPFINLQAGKFYKTFDPVRLAKIPLGFFHALYILLKYKPSIIMSFGGYLAVPVVLAGKILGIPIVTHEQTLTIGYANLLISKFASKILVSWPESLNNFPKSKAVYTGLPIRSNIFEVKTSNFISNNNFPTIYITAGKTGSHKINTVINKLLPTLLEKYNLIHQCGDYSELNDYQTLQDTYDKIKSVTRGNYFLRKFVRDDEIGEAFSRSSLVISRSGAHICAELLSLSKPSILIPIPWVSHNEQEMNANMVREKGLAEILKEGNLTTDILLALINSMFDNISKYKLVMPTNTITNSEELILKELIDALKKK